MAGRCNASQDAQDATPTDQTQGPFLLMNIFWGHAVLTAAHIHNRVPSHSHEDLSPLEHWTGKAPGIGHLRVFGSTAWVHIPKERRQKLDPKSVKGILVGYQEDAGSRVYRVYNAVTKKLLLSRDVIFDESREEHRKELSQTTIGWIQEEPTVSPQVRCNSGEEFQHLDPVSPPPTETGSPVAEDIQDQIVLRPQLARIQDSPSRQKQGEIVEEQRREQGGSAMRRSQRNRRPAELFRPGVHFALVANCGEPEPQTLIDALNCSEKAKWKQAWESELSSLAQNNTWVLEPLPENRIAIGCRWLFKKKEDGRYKARLVAKGYSQQAGIDYQETYAPVAKFTTIRLLLALCSESDWEMQGMDVKTAFLNSELKETVYMEIPEGVSIPVDHSGSGNQQPMACRLLKSIYGLKQSPRAWYGRIHSFFLTYNFVRSESDHSLFINYQKPIILLLYVDDLVLAAPTQTLVDWMRAKLSEEFDMTDLGELRTFLGLEIERDRQQRTLFLSQKNYIAKILADHGMIDCNPSSTPADPHVRLEKSADSFVPTEAERRRYQSAVGSLMYAMLGTRPDLAYGVSRVSQYNTAPNQTHWTAVKRIFRYLAGTRNRGLLYRRDGNGSGFTDADWGSGEDRRSIGGYAFVLNGAAICWNSKKQATVALSSTEAEYMALTQAVKESLWLQGILLDIGARKHHGEVENINVDNQGAIALARNPEFHARTKHISIQYHFIREHIKNGEIELTYCHTSEMTADIFTKALPEPSFARHCRGLGLIDQPTDEIHAMQGEDGNTRNCEPGPSTGEGRYYNSLVLRPWSPDTGR